MSSINCAETGEVIVQAMSSLQETARPFSTSYSTAIDGTLLTQERVVQVVSDGLHFLGREREQAEVLGCDSALDEAEEPAKASNPLAEVIIRRLHAPAYRFQQNASEAYTLPRRSVPCLFVPVELR
jgi:hypothetical protein